MQGYENVIRMHLSVFLLEPGGYMESYWVENYDTSSGNFFFDGCVALPQGGGGVLYFFRIRRLGPSIYHSPPKNIRNLKHPKKYLKF